MKSKTQFLFTFVNPQLIFQILFNHWLKKESTGERLAVFGNPYSFAQFAAEAFYKYFQKEATGIMTDIIEGKMPKAGAPAEVLRRKAEEQARKKTEKEAKVEELMSYYKRMGIVGAVVVMCCLCAGCACCVGGFVFCARAASLRSAPSVQPTQAPPRPNVEIIEMQAGPRPDLEAQLAQIRNPKAEPLTLPDWGNALQGGFEHIDVGREPSVVDL